MADPTIEEEGMPDTFSKGLGGMTIDELMAQSGVQDRAIDHATNVIQKNTAKAEAAISQREKLQNTNAGDSYDVNLEQLNNAAKAQDSKIDFSQAVAGHMIDLGKQLDKATADLAKTDDQLVQTQQAEYEKHKGEGFFAQTLHALMFTPGDNDLLHLSELREAQEKKVTDLSLGLQKANVLIQQNNANQNDLVGPLSLANRQKQAAIVASAFTDKALELKLEGLRTNTEGVLEVVKMGAEKLTNREKILNIDSLIQARKLQALALEESIALRKERMEKKLATDIDRTNMANDVRFGLQVLNKSSTKLPDEDVFRYLNAKNELGDQFRMAEQIGAHARAFSEVKISDNPGVSAIAVVQNDVPLAPEMKRVRDIMTASYSATQEGKVASPGMSSIPAQGNPAVISKERNVVATQTAQNILAVASGYAKNIKVNDHSNPYESPAFKGLAGGPGLGDMPAIKSNPLYQKVFKAQVENGMTQVDPQRLVDLTIAAIKDKTISYNEGVVGLHLLFNASIKLNNELVNYKSVGFPEQTSYKTNLQIKKNHRTWDMSDMTNVNSVLVQALMVPDSEVSGPHAGGPQ